MIVSEKSHQNLSDYIQFLFRKDLNMRKEGIISNEKMRNSGNYIYDYAHSLFVEDFKFNALYWYIVMHILFILNSFKKLKPLRTRT